MATDRYGYRTVRRMNEGRSREIEIFLRPKPGARGRRVAILQVVETEFDEMIERIIRRSEDLVRPQ